MLANRHVVRVHSSKNLFLRIVEIEDIFDHSKEYQIEQVDRNKIDPKGSYASLKVANEKFSKIINGV
jgi:hypothetical protein